MSFHARMAYFLLDEGIRNYPEEYLDTGSRGGEPCSGNQGKRVHVGLIIIVDEIIPIKMDRILFGFIT